MAQQLQIRNSTAEFLIFQLEVVCRKFRRTTQTKKSSAQLSAHENFFLKNTTSGKRLIFNTYRLLYIFTFPPNYPIFGIKAL